MRSTLSIEIEALQKELDSFKKKAILVDRAYQKERLMLHDMVTSLMNRIVNRIPEKVFKEMITDSVVGPSPFTEYFDMGYSLAPCEIKFKEKYLEEK